MNNIIIILFLNLNYNIKNKKIIISIIKKKMLNNQDDLIEEVLKIINAHKIKSNSLKNYFLRNINNNETASQILGHLNE